MRLNGLLSQEHHLYNVYSWNQTKRQSSLGIGSLGGRVAEREAGLTC